MKNQIVKFAVNRYTTTGHLVTTEKLDIYKHELEEFVNMFMNMSPSEKKSEKQFYVNRKNIGPHEEFADVRLENISIRDLKTGRFISWSK